MSRLFVPLIAGLGGLAAWGLAGRPAPAEPAFVVEEPVRDLGPVPLGRHPVVFAIHNPASRPRDVLGGGGVCAGGACLGPKRQDLPDRLTVPAGGTLELECELAVSRPGRFEVWLTLYLEDNGSRRVRLAVRGVGVGP